MSDTPHGSTKAPAKETPQRIRCNACPIMCIMLEGRRGVCDRYANEAGKVVRCDPLTILDARLAAGDQVKPFLGAGWDDSLSGDTLFVTAIGAGTTYPDFKPAPYIISQKVEGADMITVVTEAVFSYCGVKIKIDTDRHIGDETALVRVDEFVVGHVMTGEYGSQMLSLGGVDHLTGGTKKNGKVTAKTLMALCNREAVELTIDGGATVVVQAGHAPIVDGMREIRMRVGCGSATIGMFADQWRGLVDEVVVVDDHITGVVSEHQAGKVLGWENTGIKILGRRSTAGRYFQVANPGLGWGGTDIENPLAILGPWDAGNGAREGLRLLMVSTTGEQYGYFELNGALEPVEKPLPEPLRNTVDLIAENCEPSLCSVLFMGGAGGSLRAGVTQNPVQLTRSVKAGDTQVTSGGAEAYIWPGGGITMMVNVLELPDNAYGYVPTPALVAPLEFTMSAAEYARLGGHVKAVREVRDILENGNEYGSDKRAVASPVGQLPWEKS
ncbi:MAG: 6-hydroxynicotinate reductase [Rhodobacteraceae bacterium]|nr:6-hydroxynicotinate reductase [Paracoccaceae bacterium]